MSVKKTRKVMKKYFGGGHDLAELMANDVEFTIVGTGEVHQGPEAVGAMLKHIYSVAFDAKAEITNTVYGKKGASAEFNIKGKHIGEFAGIPATGKEVDVPVVVNYDVEDGKIKRGRVYMEMPVLLEQLGIRGG